MNMKKYLVLAAEAANLREAAVFVQITFHPP